MSIRAAIIFTVCMMLAPLAAAQAESALLRDRGDVGRDLSRGDRWDNSNRGRDWNNRGDWWDRRDYGDRRRWDHDRDRGAADRLQDQQDRRLDWQLRESDRLQRRADIERERRAAGLDYRNYMVNFNGDGALRAADAPRSHYWNARNERRNRFR